MALRATHDLHTRRRSRNFGVGAALAAFVALLFGITMVKLADNAAEDGPAGAPAAAIGETG